MDSRILLYIVGIVLIFVVLFGGLVFQILQPDSYGGNNVSVVAENLDVPWGIEFLPNGDMLVTERPGSLLRIDREGENLQVYTVKGVEHDGEGGLLGVVKHPTFEDNRWVYLYMTTKEGDSLKNRVVRYSIDGDQLSNATTIIDDILGAPYHDGGRIDFGPEGKLYITVGDATQEELAQDTEALAGKILRINPDGSIPRNNPFDNPVYSYGHRNPQGLAWVDGQLWATEHGNRQHDELNKIIRGGNYGWPIIEANQTREGMKTPEIYADNTTWAPSGAVYINGSIFFAGLRGNGIYEAEIRDGSVENLDKYLTNYGRLRTVVEGPSGGIYISTNNRDGRGVPAENDDKILRINPDKFGG